MAYGEVSLKPREVDGEYEIPDAILKPSGQVTDHETIATTNMYEAVDTMNPAALEYASTEIVHGITHGSSWVIYPTWQSMHREHYSSFVVVVLQKLIATTSYTYIT